MTLSPDLPQREVTPQERKRSARLFWTILIVFPMIVGVMVAYLSVRGRQARDYGHAVYVAATVNAPAADSTRACRDVLSRAYPAVVKACTVETRSGKTTVVMQVEGERQYRVSQ